MDIYVKSYVPQWLTRVNSYTNGVLRVDQPRGDELRRRRESFIASFSGTDVWDRSRDGPNGTAVNIVPPKKKKKTEELEAHLVALRQALSIEEKSRTEEVGRWSKYEVRLKPFSNGSLSAGQTREEGYALYECTIPGIQDFAPPVFINDYVDLRQLIPAHENFDGLVFTATVFAVRRAKNIVILRTKTMHIHSGLFNLVFYHNGDPVQDQLRIISSIIATGNHSVLASYLLPERSSCRLKTQLTVHRNFDWKDDQLNVEQKKAVKDIVENRFGELPFLIQGPPGTGKTKTVVEAILQVLNLNPDARIIACGPSNTAADTIAKRLVRSIGDTKLLLRLNAPSRSFEEVPEPLLPYSHIVDNRFATPRFQKLMSYKIIVGTTSEIAELNHINCNNKGIASFETFAFTSLHQTSSAGNVKPHFTHLFLDEAGQSTEPDSISAMEILDPGSVQKICVVLAGDHRQLGPRILNEQARSAGLSQSLFERLIYHPCYSDHPLSRSSLQRNPRPKLPYLYPPFANLFRNYRSHETILMVPSQLSYNSSLSACATNVSSIADALLAEDCRVPVLFLGHNNQESAADLNSVSAWYNDAETAIILQQVTRLATMHAVEVSPAEIVVLTPFREQVLRLRKSLRAAGYSAVGVGTVEDYQGAESRIVMISMVRTQFRFLAEDRLNDVGLIDQKKRMNVALTRARELVVVTGNPSVMLSDPNWRAWLQFCDRFGTWTGHKVDFESGEGSRIADDHESIGTSSLEQAFVARTQEVRSLGTGAEVGRVDHYSDDAMIRIGHAAQLALGEADY